MATYLLDPSVIIDALNRKRGRRQLLKTLVESGETLACSAMTVMEIYAGLRPHESVATQAFLDGIAARQNIVHSGPDHCRDSAGSQARFNDRQSQRFSNAAIGVVFFA
jgi:predicted nucleic acid-binding protein